MYSYVIIDDEELIRKGTVKKLEILKDQVQCIGEAANGKSGIKLIEQLHPADAGDGRHGTASLPGGTLS